MCDDTWDVADAQVACRQLGYSGTGAVPLDDVPAGSGNIWLDDVQCSGSESMLFECINIAFGVHKCVHAQDAGVTCK